MQCGANDDEGVFVHKLGDRELSADSDADVEQLFWDIVLATGGRD